MRILTVASPHAVATRDVFFGHLKGLRKVLGEENVQSYDIIKRFNIYTHFAEWLTEHVGVEVPRSMASNMLAAEPVFGAAHCWGGQIGERADVVYLVSPMYFPMTVVEMLKAAGFQVWAYFTECPYEDEFWSRAQAPLFDLCFVSDRQSLPRFRMFNENTHYLPHAYDPEIHYPRLGPSGFMGGNGYAADSAPPVNDHDHVTFVGTGFPSRQKFLEDTDWTDIDLRLYGNWWQVGEGSPDGKLRDKETGCYVSAGYAKALPDRVDVRSPIAGYVRRRLIENQTTAQIYRGSKIGISMHRTERFYRTGGVIDPNEAYSIGPRAFELAACGLFQLSDSRPELVDVFGDGVPTFETPDDLGRLVRHYLKHDDEREALARQNLEAVQGHTFEARARQMLSIAA